MTHRSAPAPRRRGRSAAAWLAAAAATIGVAVGLVVGGALGSPAVAHEGKGIVTVEASHPAGATAVHYIVRVTWEDDGHPAEDATVTAAAVGGDGTTLTPVTLAPADDDGRYAGVVEYPEAGSWTVRFTSIDPTGTAERSEEIAPPATAGPDDDSDTTGDSDAADADDAAGFAPADDGTGSSDEAAAGDDDDGLPVWLILVALAVVVVGAATALGIGRRYRTEAEAESAQFDALEASRTSMGTASPGAGDGPQSGAGDGRDPTTPAEPGPPAAP
jgi:hypothetical protein